MSSSLTSLLKTGDRKSGVVSAFLGSGMYRVSSGGKTCIVSGAFENLPVGSKIVFIDSPDGKIFVSTSGKYQSETTVVQLDE